MIQGILGKKRDVDLAFSFFPISLHGPSVEDVRAYRTAMRNAQEVAERVLDVLSALRLQRRATRERAPRIPPGLPALVNNDSHKDICYEALHIRSCHNS